MSPIVAWTRRPDVNAGCTFNGWKKNTRSSRSRHDHDRNSWRSSLQHSKVDQAEGYCCTSDCVSWFQRCATIVKRDVCQQAKRLLGDMAYYHWMPPHFTELLIPIHVNSANVCVFEVRNRRYDLLSTRILLLYPHAYSLIIAQGFPTTRERIVAKISVPVPLI